VPEDVITVVALVIKLRLAPKLALLPVTIVERKVMSLEIVVRLQRPKNATSAVRKATSLVTALKTLAVEAVEDGAVVEEEEEEAEVEEVENVTSAVKSAISPVLALRLVEERTTPSTEAGAVAVRKRLVILVAA